MCEESCRSVAVSSAAANNLLIELPAHGVTEEAYVIAANYVRIVERGGSNRRDLYACVDRIDLRVGTMVAEGLCDVRADAAVCD